MVLKVNISLAELMLLRYYIRVIKPLNYIMIDNKMSSKKTILGVILLVVTVTGAALYISSLRKSADNFPQQLADNATSIPDQSTRDNYASLQQEATPQSTVKNVPPTPKPSQTELDKIDTSNWKVYTNTNYGYEIKYPYNWSIITRGDYQVHFLAPETPKFDPSAPGWGDVSIAMQNSGRSDAPDQYFAKTPLTFDKDNGTLYTGVNCGQDPQNPDISCTIADLTKDSREVKIEHYNELEERNGTKYVGIYYKMLDSFRFTR